MALDRDSIRHIEAIVGRGNDALVQMRKDGIVVIEQKKQVVYKSDKNKINGISKE